MLELFGVLFFVMVVMLLFGFGSASAFIDVVGRKVVIASCVVVLVVLVVFMGIIIDFMVFIVVFIFWVVLGSLMGIVFAAYVADISFKNIRGSAFAIYRTCGDVGLFFGLFVFGVFVDEVGIFIVLGVNVVLLMIFGGVFYFIAREIRRKA